MRRAPVVGGRAERGGGAGLGGGFGAGAPLEGARLQRLKRHVEDLGGKESGFEGRARVWQSGSACLLARRMVITELEERSGNAH